MYLTTVCAQSICKNKLYLQYTYLYLVADWQSYLFHDSYVFWNVMLNGDADATRH